MKLNEQNMPAEKERERERMITRTEQKGSGQQKRDEANAVNQYPLYSLSSLSVRFSMSFLWKEKSPLDA